MRYRMIAAISLMAATGFCTISLVSATAQTVKKKAPSKAPKRKMDPGLKKMLELRGMMEEGGPVGCSNTDPSCGNEAPKPVPQVITKAWLVGVWVLEDGGCDTLNSFRRIRANGTYNGTSEAGTWRLHPNGNIDFNGAPSYIDYSVFARRDGQRLKLNAGWWKRCSTNPDAPLAAASPPADAERQVAAQADGYTLYRERPGYCTLYLDTPRRAMIRFSYSADGAVNFSYVRPDLRAGVGPSSFPVQFQFDGSRSMLGIMGVDTRLDDGREGFMLAGASTELLDGWARSSQVTLRLPTVIDAPLDSIALRGSAQMIDLLKACAHPNYSVSIPPPPPEEAVTSEPAALSDRHDFGAAGTILLGFEEVSGTYGAGTITLVPRRGSRRAVTVGYMTGFIAVPAVDRVQFGVSGVVAIDKGRSHWVCEIRIDWQRGAIASSRWIEGDPETRGQCEDA